MTRLLVIAAMTIMACSPAMAQSATGVGVGIASSSSQSAARATAIGGGNAAAQGGQGGNGMASVTLNSNTPAVQTINSVASGTQTLRNVPTEFAPGLTAAGLETCLGSISGGGAFVGTGFSFGSTIPDPGCAARLDARTLWSMGLRKAAVARLCLMGDVYRSMPDICQMYLPAQPGYVVAASTAAEAAPEYTGGPVEVRLRSTGEVKMCNDYDVNRHRCRVWAHD
jgi:hypothetical protein